MLPRALAIAAELAARAGATMGAIKTAHVQRDHRTALQPPRMATSAAAVHEILVLFAAADIPTWIGGGWGIDALVGHQTRGHADLDVAVVDGRGALAALAAAGFDVVTDWWPGRVAMRRPDRAEVDVHPIVFRDDGSAVQTTHEGQAFIYPADGFSVGTIAGREVPCITAALQEAFHSGYEPQAKDLTDLATLRNAGLI